MINIILIIIFCILCLFIISALIGIHKPQYNTRYYRGNFYIDSFLASVTAFIYMWVNGI